MAIDRIRANEATTKIIEFDVLDQDDVGVPAASLTSAVMTLYDMGTGHLSTSPREGIINNRDELSVLNTNNVSINASGHVVWTMQPEDNPIITSRRQIERHRAEFTFVWPAGEFHFELEIEVVNLRRAA